MINRMVIYSKGKKLTDYRPRQQPLRANRKRSPGAGNGAGRQRQSGGQPLLFLKGERPRPNGLVTQRRLAEGAEGTPTAPCN